MAFGVNFLRCHLFGMVETCGRRCCHRHGLVCTCRENGNCCAIAVKVSHLLLTLPCRGDGEHITVAVKVLHPGVRERIEQDLDVMRSVHISTCLCTSTYSHKRGPAVCMKMRFLVICLYFCTMTLYCCPCFRVRAESPWWCRFLCARSFSVSES